MGIRDVVGSIVECSEDLHIEEQEKFRVAFPTIPGEVQLAGRFYMKRRCRPVVTRVWLVTSFKDSEIDLVPLFVDTAISVMINMC